MKKYIQLYNDLREKIEKGELPAGAQLPTECRISEESGLSRQTVRSAFDMLRKDGLIYSLRGSGSFVCASGELKADKHRIAVITTYFSEYIFPSILRSISEAAVERGYAIEISTTNNSISTERSILKGLMDRPVAGIIVEGTKAALPNPNISFYRTIAQKGIPVVFINSIYSGICEPNIVSVTTDDFKGGYGLASKLITEGYTSIGCIFKSDDAQGINRFSGVMKALSDYNVDYDDSYFLWYTTETKSKLSDLIAARDILNKCDALICYNDEVSSLICGYLRNCGTNVRFIASFDGKMNPGIVPPGVGFLSLPHPSRRLGEKASQLLFDMLDGRSVRSAVLRWEPGAGPETE